MQVFKGEEGAQALFTFSDKGEGDQTNAYIRQKGARWRTQSIHTVEKKLEKSFGLQNKEKNLLNLV